MSTSSAILDTAGNHGLKSQADVSRRRLEGATVEVLCAWVAAALATGLLAAAKQPLGVTRLLPAILLAVCSFLALRLPMLGVGRMVAVLFSALVVVHPLILHPSPTGASSLQLWLAPIVPTVIAVVRLGRSRPRATPLLLGGLCGLAIGIDPAGGIAVAFAAGSIYLIYRRCSQRAPTTHSPRLGVIVLLAFLACLVAAPAGWLLSSTALKSAALAVPGLQTVSPGPLGWFDRGGRFVDSIDVLPAELKSSGRFYLGLGLTAVAVCGWLVRRRGNRPSPASVIPCLAIALMWWLQGPDSFHAQLRSIFEFVTVRRYVAESAQNALLLPLTFLLGTITMGLFALADMTNWVRASPDIAARHPRSSAFVGYLLAASVMLTWWTVSPAGVLPGGAAGLGAVRASWCYHVLMALIWTAIAATGLQWMAEGRRTRIVQAGIIVAGFVLAGMDCVI